MFVKEVSWGDFSFQLKRIFMFCCFRDGVCTRVPGVVSALQVDVVSLVSLRYVKSLKLK